MSNPSHIRTFIKLGISLAAVVVLLAGWGIFSRMRAQQALAQEAQQESAIPVMVTKPSSEAASEDLILPGTLQAFTDTPIYARTNGYLKRWLVDIGTPVKAGQLLAEIDTPEVDQQVLQAEADLQTAEANNDLAQLTAKRWKALLATKTVSQQDADNKIGDAAAKQAALASARANLHRLRELESFKRIVAPFDGVITARNIDVGDLIDAGTGSGKARELFHMAAIRRLRVYAQVPESYAQDMGQGDKAELQVREHPGRAFEAKLVNTASAIDPASHTLLVQLEVDNASGALLPGGYAEVHFKLKTHPGSLRVSANALLFRPEGMQVAVVGKDNKVTLQTVTMGRDFGKEVEVLAGLTADQSIILNPSDSLVTGQAVKPQMQPQTSRNGK
ncbi:MAG: efflux RND transporter periplasmic adaptor subunit [Betaproteobacteria bacterium]|nr:efflux RND transporter periplasmic adaptor subunit [Betaproteobacteria bacterium]MDE2622750.1 efflux RND transporter periplasmic adaptor subunit [Betaproteobacteria bacterium]